MVSTSFSRYLLESVVRRAIEAYIDQGDARTKAHVSGFVVKASLLGDGRFAIGGFRDELEGVVYTVIWSPDSDTIESIEED